MTTLTVVSLIAIAIIGLLVVAELVAMTVLLGRVVKLTQQVRDRVDPVATQATQLLRTTNDVANTVKTDVRRVADRVTDMTGHLAAVTDHLTTRVDTTSARLQAMTTTAMDRLTSPPVLTALTLFAGLQVGAAARRLAGWPGWLALALLAGVPLGLGRWRVMQQRQSQEVDGTLGEPLVLRPRVETTEPLRFPRAA